MPTENHPSFHGILPALITPLDDQGRLLPAALERLLAALYATDIQGVYVCGQTGEGPAQPVEQRMQVLETTVRCTPAGKSVIAHVGAASQADAIALARHAAKAGAHAISSLPPFGAYSFGEIRAWYEALAHASELPLLIYYFPDLFPALAGTAQVLELAALPNVMGLKFTDFDLYKMWCIKQTGKLVYNGRDEVLAAGLLMGADGGIGTFYNLAPDWFAELFCLARAGEWAAARLVQDDINELIRIGLQFPAIAAVKKILSWMGLDCGVPMAPRDGLTREQEQRLFELLAPTRFGRTKMAAAAVS
jgi:N-acetylneuraminate lyase